MKKEEIKRRLQDAIVIKKDNPALVYKIIKKIGRGGFGVIFEVLRIRFFAIRARDVRAAWRAAHAQLRFPQIALTFEHQHAVLKRILLTARQALLNHWDSENNGLFCSEGSSALKGASCGPAAPPVPLRVATS